MTTEPTTREQFFKNQLIPLGQMFELLLKLMLLRPHTVGQVASRQKQIADIGHTVFDALNLAACYAINPANTDLAELSRAVTMLTHRVRDLFNAFGTSGPTLALALVEGKSPRCSSAVWTFFNKEMDSLLSELPMLMRDVHRTIGYTSLARSSWLRAQTDARTALTPGRRVCKWRTFVRHTSWSLCLEMLGAKLTEVAGTRLSKRFSTRVGIANAEVLWGRAFASATPVITGEAAVGPAPERLPPGLEVTSTPQGLLELRATFEPTELLLPTERQLFKTKVRNAPKPLVEMLRSRTFRIGCDIAGLVQATALASTWLARQPEDRQIIVDAFARWTADMREKELMDKYTRTFSAEERKELEAILSGRSRPVLAPVQPAVSGAAA